LKDPGTLDKILAKGSEDAAALATQHLKEIKEIVGFLRV